MNLEEILDSLEHEFLLVKMKRELDHVNDPEQLRQMGLVMVDLCEKQKEMFKQLLYTLIEEDPEAQEMFE